MDTSITEGSSLDLSGYVPFYLVSIANKWTSTSSRTYLQKFKIGVAEFRVLASLGAFDQVSSLEIATLVGMDPAAVSRAVRMLVERKLISAVAGRFAGRTKPYRMTTAGSVLFRAVRDLALRREAILLAELSQAEKEQLLRLLKKMRDRLPRLQSSET